MTPRPEIAFSGLVALLLLSLFPEACVAKEQSHQCTPSSCGLIPNISYPFRLKSDPPKCGVQSYELACEYNRTTLYACGGKYYVQEISYDYSRMRVVDASLVDQVDNCSILHYSLTDRSFRCDTPFSLNYDASLVIMNCTQPVKSSSVYVDVTPCINDSSSPKTNFYRLYKDIQWVSDLHEKCRIEVVVPRLPPLISIQRYSILDIHHALSKGFDLKYHYWSGPSFKERVQNFFQGFWNDFRDFLQDLQYFLFSLPGYHKMFGDKTVFGYRGNSYTGFSYRGRYASYVIKAIVKDLNTTPNPKKYCFSPPFGLIGPNHLLYVYLVSNL